VADQIEKIEPMTREEMRKYKKNKPQKKDRRQRPKKIRIRLIPIWLRLLIILFLVIASALVGIVVGFGVIGNGNPLDAFHKETWQHIIDIINKK
jgi:hypothetical protein